MSRDLRLISLSLFLWGVGETLFLYTQTLYLEQLGADPLQIGAVLGLFAAAMTITHIPAGALADRFGRRSILLAGWIIGLVSAIIMYLAQSLTPFVIGLVLYGFTGFVIAPLSSYIAGARAQMPVTRALTTAYAFFNVGGVLGPLFAWSLGDRVTLRGAYGLACVIFTLSTVTVTLTGDQPIEPSNGDRRAAGLLRNRRFATFLLISAVFLFGGYLSWPLTPNYLQSLRDIPARTIWLFGALNSLGMVTISFTLGHLSAKRGIFIIQTLVIASILFFWRGPGMVWYGLAYLLAGGYRTLRSFISAQVESLVQPANLGLAFGAVETTIGLVMVAAPPLAGWLYQRTPESPYTVSLGVLLLALPLTALISPGRARLPRWIRTSFNHKHRRKEAGG